MRPASHLKFTPLLPFLISLLAVIGVSDSASATGMIQQYFTRTGQTESLVAPFNVFGGSTTTQQWAGLIEVLVSGSGINVPADYFHEDAFYPFDPADPSIPVQGPGILPPNSLHISFTGCSASAECGALRISNFFIFVDGVGFVTVPPEMALPDPISQITIEALLDLIPYSPEHLYHFVIGIGPASQKITLGHGDGGVWDNSGEYHIQLFGVSAHPVPEPAAWLLFGTGLAVLKAGRKTILRSAVLPAGYTKASA